MHGLAGKLLRRQSFGPPRAIANAHEPSEGLVHARPGLCLPQVAQAMGGVPFDPVRRLVAMEPEITVGRFRSGVQLEARVRIQIDPPWEQLAQERRHGGLLVRGSARRLEVKEQTSIQRHLALVPDIAKAFAARLELDVGHRRQQCVPAGPVHDRLYGHEARDVLVSHVAKVLVEIDEQCPGRLVAQKRGGHSHSVRPLSVPPLAR